MDKDMANKSKNEGKIAESLARHLASLIGTSVAGFLPDYDGTSNLDEELFTRKNVAISRLVIMSGLIQRSELLNAKVLRDLKDNGYREDSFELHVVRSIESKGLEGDVDIDEIRKDIDLYCESVDPQSSEGYYFRWFQVLKMKPSDKQVQRAIEILMTIKKS
jgi:hypothetical protein